MTYIKVEQTHTDDERWIEAGADAFAVHIAALVYCDRQLNDGKISEAMASRVSLAVQPDRTIAAIRTLVDHGFWSATENGYQIEKYDEHAFPAEQIKRTRKRWETDKRRRAQHQVGDHSLCKDPKFCPAVRDDVSTVESTVDSTGGRSHLYKTQPDQTRPDRRDGSGKGDAVGTAPATAGPPSPRVVVSGFLDEGDLKDPTPWDLRVHPNGYGDPDHAELTIEMARNSNTDSFYSQGGTFSAVDFREGQTQFLNVACEVARQVTSAIDALADTHNCDNECTVEVGGLTNDDPDPYMTVAVPLPLLDAWTVRLADLTETVARNLRDKGAA